MHNVIVRKKRLSRTSQGDIFREIECIEYVAEKQGIIEVSKIVFPVVVVLTQDCDLEQDARYRTSDNNDKRLFSVLVAPLYNAEHVFDGHHLEDLNLKMAETNKRKTPGQDLMKNLRPRYHYLEFPAEIPVVPSIVDFKHFFSVSITYLEELRPKNFVCRLSVLFREDLSQRFAFYLARIGLPDLIQDESKPAPTPGDCRLSVGGAGAVGAWLTLQNRQQLIHGLRRHTEREQLLKAATQRRLAPILRTSALCRPAALWQSAYPAPLSVASPAGF